VILLDTNVVSEVMAPAPAATVLEWLDARDAATLYISTVTIAEIGYGLRILPAGKRRQLLEGRFEEFVELGFDQRVLSFDHAAARFYAELMARRREIGRPMGIADGQIAAIARANRLAVATRNVRDFEECGLEIMNPFEDRT
jgi:predicted nucleic acid-binding protein